MNHGIIDLTWTGNIHLAPGVVGGLASDFAANNNITRKGEVYSENVCNKFAHHHGIAEDYVIAGGGTTQVIDAVLRYLKPDPLIDIIPNFHLAHTISIREHWDYMPVPLRDSNEFCTTLDAFSGWDRSVVVLSSPRNPFGEQVSLEVVERFLSRYSGWVLLDEAYADFAPDTALRLVEKYPRLIVTRTMSKAWGIAGMRIGFAVSQLFAKLRSIPEILPNSVNIVAQSVALSLLSAPEEITSSIEQLKKDRSSLFHTLNAVEGLRVRPSDANYLFVESDNAKKIAHECRQCGFEIRLVHDLKGYPADWPSAVRFSVPPKKYHKALTHCFMRAITGHPRSVVQ